MCMKRNPIENWLRPLVTAVAVLALCIPPVAAQTEPAAAAGEEEPDATASEGMNPLEAHRFRDECTLPTTNEETASEGIRAAVAIAKLFPDKSPEEGSQFVTLLSAHLTLPILVSPHAEERALQMRLLEMEVEIAEESCRLAGRKLERLGILTDPPRDEVESAKSDILHRQHQLERARILLQLFDLQAKRLSDGDEQVPPILGAQSESSRMQVLAPQSNTQRRTPETHRFRAR